jgi:hypothetical protein
MTSIVARYIARLLLGRFVLVLLALAALMLLLEFLADSDQVIAASDDADRAFTLSVAPAPGDADGDAQGPYTFTSRGALPSALWVRHAGERRPLEIVDTNVDHSWSSHSASDVLETVVAGGDIASTYAVPADLPVGTYVSRGLFGVSWGVPDQTPGEHGMYPFELEVTIE